MDKYERILLATDFSEQAGKAQAEAVRLARKHGAELHVLYVDVIALQGAGTFQDPPIPDHVHSIDQLSTEAGPFSKAIGYERTVFKICRASTEAAGILRYAAESKADIIVVGTHGRSAVTEMLMGSVAQEVAHRAPVSVLVAGAGAPDAPRDRGAPVLVAVDFSEGSRGALLQGARVAAAERSPLIALHVVNFNRVTHPEELGVGEREQRSREELARFVAAAALPVEAETQLSIGPAGDDIPRIATDRRASLIVLAASKHTTLERLMLLGSVTKAVIRKAPCPVLIYREPAPPVQAAVTDRAAA